VLDLAAGLFGRELYVYSFTQTFAGFEVWNTLFRNGHAFTGTGIPSLPGGAPVDGKTAKASDFDPMPLDE
jgi:hypothetical protein